MQEKVHSIEEASLKLISSANDIKSLEHVKNIYLGRKGEIAALFGEMGKLSPEDKKAAGALLNQLKSKVELAYKEKEDSLKGAETISILQAEGLDITIPGKKIERGTKHILTRTLDEMISVFTSMGYSVALGPEVETDYYNFEALNIPADHPSKDMWSTFYVNGGDLLRTHTSPVQIRVMEKNKPPFAAVFPGRVFRRDAADGTHLPVFHQLEGLAVSEDITMSDLKGTLTHFLRKMFGKDRKVRFRPSYFPFTEPSAEVDVECFVCSGKGCRLCKNTGWLEILGAGMVDPNVFKAVGYDPEKVSGFAFGMGVERIAMHKYGIDDIRVFFENDVRFLRML